MSVTAVPPCLDAFMPRFDVRERFTTIVHAPAPIVLDTACDFDLQRFWLVRLIFRARELVMGASTGLARGRQGILAETLGLGWGLMHRDDRLVAVGARCQPWRGDVVFTAIPAEQFAGYSEPEQVKILWTLEVDPIGPEETRFSHETRAVATDDSARRRFLSYWRWARFGIVAIRYLMLPAVRRGAEARWKRTRLGSGQVG
jgi:hypothetical protein